LRKEVSAYSLLAVGEACSRFGRPKTRQLRSLRHFP
jgi:hypothetical protein